jgi:hypothetical protein
VPEIVTANFAEFLFHASRVNKQHLYPKINGHLTDLRLLCARYPYNGKRKFG